MDSKSVESDNRESERDRFKESFKKYKSCKDVKSFCNFKEVFDANKGNEFLDQKIAIRRSMRSFGIKPEVDTIAGALQMHWTSNDCKPLFGLSHPSTWEVFDFAFPNGLIFVKNPFTSEGQKYWITKCLNDYPKEPHITNIDNLSRRQPKAGERERGESNELAKTKSDLSSDDRDTFYKDLRWITFGYHHDWDTKVYSENYRCEFPPDLSVLTKYMSLVLGYDDFEAEAAIVNYYHLDSTLSGHVDRSEKNQYAPLFSLSFGQTAVFLIGSTTKDTTPLAVYLKSGDIVVMTGQSRLSYHGVPKIISSPAVPWKESLLDDSSSEMSNNCSNLRENEFVAKKLKLDRTSHSRECKLCSLALMSEFKKSSENVTSVLDQWSDFHESYISKSRINLNVRQVLFPGQNSLEDKVGS